MHTSTAIYKCLNTPTTPQNSGDKKPPNLKPGVTTPPSTTQAWNKVTTGPSATKNQSPKTVESPFEPTTNPFAALGKESTWSPPCDDNISNHNVGANFKTSNLNDDQSNIEKTKLSKEETIMYQMKTFMKTMMDQQQQNMKTMMEQQNLLQRQLLQLQNEVKIGSNESNKDRDNEKKTNHQQILPLKNEVQIRSNESNEV